MSDISEVQECNTKLYRIEFQKAWELWRNDNDGDDAVALDIALRMRTYPDLTLFRRAWVNILIGVAANMGELDVKKYLDESLAIVAEMRRIAPEMNWDRPKILKAIQRTEEFANGCLREAKRVEAIRISEGKKVFPPFVPTTPYSWKGREPVAGGVEHVERMDMGPDTQEDIDTINRTG